MEGCAVELDLDGGAVPWARAGEGFSRRWRWREGDGTRGSQEVPRRQPRKRGVHERVPLCHSVEQEAGAACEGGTEKPRRGRDANGAVTHAEVDAHGANIALTQHTSRLRHWETEMIPAFVSGRRK